MNDKINLTTSSNANVEASIICFLENIETGKRYLYYTLNEIVGTDPNSTVKIYVTKVRQNNPALDTPISEEEWKLLKDYMAEALKGISNTNIKYLPISELSDAVSISDRVIAMPVSYDYINKHRGVYAEKVAREMEMPVNAIKPEVSLEPIVEGPTIQEEILPTTEPLVTPEPIMAEPVAEEVKTEAAKVNNDSNIKLTAIDLNEIEQKYAEMIGTINKLKEQEIEAAKRYNATIELSAMHNEQHANYVANEQNKEVTEVPVENVPIEPEPITPIVPTPVNIQPTNSTDIETNWFDMPEQQ